MSLDARIPEGPIQQKWDHCKFEMKLVSPANRRKRSVIVVGTGLAGASAAASLGEMGYNVSAFTYHDSPRRAHSIAAQGGINAPKNYANDGDSIYRLFYDTIKGGDYRAREANVYRLAQLSGNIIDHCVAQGVPFAREYGGLLANRSFGGVQVSRTFYARGQTGQQLLLGAYGALSRQVHTNQVRMFSRTEMLDLIVVDGRARGIVARDLVSGKISSHMADAVILATGGYSNVFYLSTNAINSNATAIWRAHKRGAYFANPCFTQIHPTCIPRAGESQSKLTLMSESLRNDGRIWVPKQKGDKRRARDIPESDRDYYLERIYPSFGNLVPRDVASRRAKEMCDNGYGVAGGYAVYLDFADAIQRDGKDSVEQKYGNLFDIYHEITGENPYTTAMKIYPAPHYTMGGLWVDYHLMTTIPGLFALGEANFSDHGANRLGASALMQCLTDGYFVLPYTIGDYLAKPLPHVSEDAGKPIEREVTDRLNILSNASGSQTAMSLHQKLGHIMWDKCGMSRNETGLKEALNDIKTLKETFQKDLKLSTPGQTLNQELERANRVADYIELGELMVQDALTREESCGGHFREEHQTEENEAKRNDENQSYVSAWAYSEKKEAVLHKEALAFDHVKPTQRSYK